MERIFICLAVLLAYSSVWPNTFVFDDGFLIVKNEFLKRWDNLPKLLTTLNFSGAARTDGFYRPVPALLHFFVYQAFGPSTIAFHALNIALHALNACLLFYFGVRAGFGRAAAFAAALLWALHPLHTEAVAYMSSTPELLWSTFSLLGLIALLPDFTTRKIWLAAVFFVLALGCKESAVVFPALAAATIFLVDKDRTQFSSYLKTWPFWLLSAAYTSALVIKTGYSMDQTGNPLFYQEYTTNLANRILTCLATLPVYARLIIWPEGLHMDRSFPISSTLLAWRPAAGALMIGFALIQILKSRTHRGLALSFGLLWFAVAQSPNTGILLPINARVSEHWMYLPTMGLFLGTAQMAAGIFEKRKNAARLLVLALTLSLGIATFFQNEKWRDPETLYQNTLQNGGNPARLAGHLGNYYLSRHEFDKALDQFQFQLDNPGGRPAHRQAVTHVSMAAAWLQADLDENYIITADSILRALPSSRHTPEAIRELGQAVLIDPENYWARKFLAIIYRYQGNDPMAEFHEKQAEDILKRKAK